MHVVPTRRSVAFVAAGALCVATSVGGCTAAPAASPASQGGDPVTVAAASSLTDVFAALRAAYPRAADVSVDSASSSALALRIEEGAPVDVFAAADLTTMRRLRRDGLLLGAPRVFARTTLVVVVAPGNPAGVTALDDLTRPDVRTALAAPAVPLGRYTAAMFARAGLAVPTGATRESNARAVLTKVALGEVDAGVVYRPDVATTAPPLRSIEVPASAQVTVEYPIAVPATTDDRTGAEDFVRFVLSPRGRAVLRAAGYEVP